MDFPAKSVSKRYAAVASLLVLAGVLVFAKAIIIMTKEKDYWMAINDRFVRENDTIPATRGNILADDGEILAASLPEYKVYMDFMSWEKTPKRRDKEQHLRDSLLNVKMDSICQGMHAIIPEIDPAEFRKHLLEGREKKSHHWLLYKKRVSYITFREIKKLPIFCLSSNKGGLHTEEFKTRKNPYGKLAIRTIGDLYRNSGEPRTGLELSFNDTLKGKPGISHRQKVYNRFLNIVDKPAENGCDVQTTLNVGMQDIVEKALNDKLTELNLVDNNVNSGVCILMEVATGDIKAMSSLRKMNDGSFQEINADAVKNLYEPGSVFKPMSFLVGMDDGYIHMTDQVDVGNGIKEMYGRKMRDANWRSGGSGVVTVPQILQKSLNVGVSTLIDRAYHKDPRKFVEGIYRIGVAEDLKIPIPGYAKPRIRMPNADLSNWSKTALPWMSIGYETQIPPITTVNFYNGIANNGKLLRPRLVKAILRDGKVVKEYPVEVLREQMAKPEAVKNIQECLESVVSVGLGKKAGSKMFHTSGKTGTAQIWTKNGFAAQYLVSFAGYFPSDKPLYSCIVCIQKGAPASGGGMCAPVFKRVAETVMAQRRSTNYQSVKDTVNCLNPVINAGDIVAAQSVLDQLGISYNSSVKTDEAPITWGNCATSSKSMNMNVDQEPAKGTVPNVKGYGLRDALYRLEQLGLKVTAKGVGCVTKQSLEPGHKFAKGEKIVLILGDPKDIPAAERDSLTDDVVGDADGEQTAKKDEPEDVELASTAQAEREYQQKQHEAEQQMKKKEAERAEANAEEQRKKREQNREAENKKKASDKDKDKNKDKNKEKNKDANREATEPRRSSSSTSSSDKKKSPSSSSSSDKKKKNGDSSSSSSSSKKKQ